MPQARGSPEIVIIGAGIMGLSAAYHLAATGQRRVLVLEREPLPGTGSTGRCAGGFRHQFSTEINIRLSIESVRMILDFERELECRIDVHQDGYLFLLSHPEEVRAFGENVSLQNRLGVGSQMVAPDEIRRLAPHMNLDGVLAGAYCAQDGIADPAGMTQGYAAGARRLGVEIRTGAAAVGIRTAGGRITGVDTTDGHIACGAVINAGGPHAGEIARWAGIDLPVHPERRHVCTTMPFPQAPPNYLMVIDFATTFYCHRESGGVLMGMGNPDEVAGFNLNVDPEFVERILEAAVRRYPALGEAGIRRSWAGLYEMSPDAHPILGRVEELGGFYAMNGFSGHGFQHGPIAGKLVAEEVLFGSARSLDIAPLRLNRFSGGAIAREANVV